LKLSTLLCVVVPVEREVPSAWSVEAEESSKEERICCVAGLEREGSGEMRWEVTLVLAGEDCTSWWKTWTVLGQFPPRLVVRLVARSLASSGGKCGTL
jgi:hypothetical protein